jgi:hypothetical protein
LAVDAHQRLYEAQQAAMEGRHEEALRGFVWFHNHALKHQPSLYGVRLSFALWYWTELAKAYPKAGRALEHIRKRNTAALLNGGGNPETFHDVASINQHLKKGAETHRLFVRLDAARPRLAAKCARFAMRALVDAGDFRRARRYTPDPAARLVRHAAFLNQELPKIPERIRKSGTKAPVKDAYISNYCDDAKLLIAILRGAGERKAAAQLRHSAVAMIAIPSARREVAERLGR